MFSWQVPETDGSSPGEATLEMTLPISLGPQKNLACTAQRAQEVVNPDYDASYIPCGDNSENSVSPLLPHPPPQRAEISLSHLPPELLLEIFFLCLPEDFHIVIPHDDDSKRDFLPWKLGHVCSRWREIVWSSSWLWSCIKFTVPRISHNNRSLDMADTVFRLAGNLVLDLCADGPSYDFNPIHAYVEPNLARFVCLRLTLNPSLTIDLLSISKGSLDALRWFGLGIAGELDKKEVSRAGAVAFRTASHLQTVRFFPHAGSDIPSLIRMQFPWSQITDLSMTSPGIRPCDALRILSQCSELTSCCFLYIEGGPGADPGMTLPVGSISLPQLDFFDLDLTHGTPADEILSFLVLPSLSRLGLASTNVDDSAALTRFFTRSSCPLQVLKLEGYFRDLGPILSAVPLLKILDAPKAYLRSSWMHTLPAQLLKFRCCVTREDAFSFLDMLETRLQTEIGPRGWETTAEVGVENANEELILMLESKLVDLVMRYGWANFVEFHKLEAGH